MLDRYKCVNTLHRSKFHGIQLRVEIAREDQTPKYYTPIRSSYFLFSLRCRRIEERRRAREEEAREIMERKAAAMAIEEHPDPFIPKVHR